MNKYFQGAEFIRVSDKGKDSESVVRFSLWKLALPQKTLEEHGQVKALDVVEDHDIIKPVFDEFRQVFIITFQNESFLMDLDGEYDRNALGGARFKWQAGLPKSVQIVRPFIVGFMAKDNNIIEIKHLFAPHTATQHI